MILVQRDKNGAGNVLNKGIFGLAWENAMGGYAPIEPEDVESASNVHAIDPYSQTLYRQTATAIAFLETALEENLGRGVITPKGDYYGLVDTPTSDYFLEMGMKTSQRDMDLANSVTLTPRAWTKLLHGDDNTLTQAQSTMLQRVGRDPDNKGAVIETMTYTDAFPDGNATMDKMFALVRALKHTQSMLENPISKERKMEIVEGLSERSI